VCVPMGLRWYNEVGNCKSVYITEVSEEGEGEERGRPYRGPNLNGTATKSGGRWRERGGKQ